MRRRSKVDRKSTRLNSSHLVISYAVFCLKKELKAIRDVMAKDMYVRLDAPSQVRLFVYDTDRFIFESFQEMPVEALFFFFNDTATTEIYTLSLHDALPI